MTDAYDAEQLADLDRRIDGWLAELADEHDHIIAVDRSHDDGGVRWYVRMRGDDKEFTTVWLTLGQRMLRYETYVMPAPEENHLQFYEHLLRRNRKLHGMAFCIGDEDAVFLAGALPVHALDTGELDRVLGSFYAYVEQCFLPALRIGYASRFPAPGA